MIVNKAIFLLPLILSIGIVSVLPYSFSQVDNEGELDECRDGFIIVYLINANRFSCVTPDFAERWVELGLAEIKDPNYEPIVEEPEIVVEQSPIAESIIPEVPEIPEEIFEIVDPPRPSEIVPTPTYDIIEKEDNRNPLPGTPRKVGQQGIVASGVLLLEVYDQHGNLKHRHENHNLVVDVGLETLADLAFGTTHVTGESAGGFSWISVGTGGTAPDSADTDCETQHGSKKQDASVTNTALGAVINVSWVAELGAGTLQEICLTDNGSAATGNLFSRQTYAGVPILGTDTVNAEWTITFADSNGS